MNKAALKNIIINAFRDWMLRGGFSPMEVFGNDPDEILDEYTFDKDSVSDTGLSVIIYSEARKEAWEIDLLRGWNVRDVSGEPYYQQLFDDYMQRDVEPGFTRRDRQIQEDIDRARGK